MRTAIGARKRKESALIRPQFGRTTNGHLRLSELALLRSLSGAAPASAVYKPSQVLATNLASLTEGRKKRKTRSLTTDRTLHTLSTDLVSARVAAGMTQAEVAARMWTTKSVVSRLESGRQTRPTLTTIERYAAAVGATVEIRVGTRRSLESPPPK